MTSTIRLGTAVLIMPYFTPILLAKQLATLDLVSGGRLDVGLGIGWSEDEYEAVGVPFRQRGRRGDEFLRCLKAIWTEDPVEFAGEFYRVPRAQVEPHSVQQPHPPILIGGYGETVIDRVVPFGDGFLGGNVRLERVQPLIQKLAEAAERARRDPRTLHIVCRGSFRLQSQPQGTGRRPLWGTLAEIQEDLLRYAEAGVTELFLEANFNVEPDQVERASEAMEALAPAT
jgi:probable F420-dependent oxidoreductase